MSDLAPRSNVGDLRLRADLSPSVVHATTGEPAVVTIEVTNMSDVIRSFEVGVIGLDPSWVSVDSPVIELFPGERGAADLSILLPASFPAGEHRIGVQISETGVPQAADVVAEFDLLSDAAPGLTLQVDPSSTIAGKSTTYVATVTNTGNTVIEVGARAQDPERVVEGRFFPPQLRLAPGATGSMQLDVSARRPWFGMSVVRSVEVSAFVAPRPLSSPDQPELAAFSAVAFIQKPRFTRRVVSIAGLLLAVTMFALVINASFASVADMSRANEALLKASLGEDVPLGPRPEPARITGLVSSSTGGGIDGVTVELYEDETSAVVPVASTVTDSTGAFGFRALAPGTYRVRVEAAGFGQLWFPQGETIAEAFPIELEGGSEADGLSLVLTGRPGTVAGRVLADDPDGAIVSVQIPAGGIDGSDAAAEPALVASVVIDATGMFELADLPTPSAYELVVSKPGYATEFRSVDLGPGQNLGALEVLLRRGEGRISGLVVDVNGNPLPGVTVWATDGLGLTSTRTLSGEDTVGSFEVRDLTTPATYTLSVEAPGFEPQSVTVVLARGQKVDDLRIVVAASTGSIGGIVTGSDDAPLGGISITVVGANVSLTTRSLSVDAVGTWSIRGLPVPGNYTVTFRGEGLRPQALAVDLPVGIGADRNDINVRLSPALASIRGSVGQRTVGEREGGLAAGVTVVLASSTLERRTITANDPIGQYEFNNLPPGSYTVTFSKRGLVAQTLLIEVAAGQIVEVPLLEMDLQTRIFGKFVRNDLPVGGVIVEVVLAENQTVVAATTQSDRLGEFEIFGLTPNIRYSVIFIFAGSDQGSLLIQLGVSEELDLEEIEL
jgi:protocatechuate 3,4-dioxygenase beta subunit